MSVFRNPPPPPPPRGRGGWSPRPSGWQRFFATSENPLEWALRIGTYFGISVRIGLLYLVWMGFELARYGSQGALASGVWIVASLFIIVLLHEFGHCFACRRVGGQADRILMWPLGGLASCSPPHTWWANFVTTAGGPLVNVALVPVFGAALLAIGQGWNVLFFNPFTPFLVTLDYSGARVSPWVLQMLFWTYYTNWILLLFNVLIPMFPMDGGRLVQALLWKRFGYTRSMDITTRVGLFAAVVLGLIALSTQAMMLLGIAIFGGLTCINERRKLRFMAQQGFASGEEGESWRVGPTAVVETPGNRRRAEKLRQQAERERAARDQEATELDRILAKIKAGGMGSLTRSEESFLRRTREKMSKD